MQQPSRLNLKALETSTSTAQRHYLERNEIVEAEIEPLQVLEVRQARHLVTATDAEQCS